MSWYPPLPCRFFTSPTVGTFRTTFRYLVSSFGSSEYLPRSSGNSTPLEIFNPGEIRNFKTSLLTQVAPKFI